MIIVGARHYFAPRVFIVGLYSDFVCWRWILSPDKWNWVKRSVQSFMNIKVPTPPNYEEHMLNLALIQYLFTEGEHDVKDAPTEIQSKERVLFRQCQVYWKGWWMLWPTAQLTLSYVDDQLGGMFTASSAGALPRGQQQINDICRPKEAAEFDPLYSLMLMCKEAEGKNPQEVFVRLVKLHLIPWCWMTLSHFVQVLVNSVCLELTQFSLWVHFLVVTTHHHFLFHKKGDRTKPPTMIGPLFIHVKKDFAT